MPAPTIEVAEAADRTAARLVLRGTVGVASANQLLAKARDAERRALPVVVDAKEAEHLDASALQVLVALARAVRASGRTFALVDAPAKVRDYVRMAGLAAELATEPAT